MIEHSAFDSQIYGMRIGRLVLDAPEAIPAALIEARDQRFDVVFLRVDESDVRLVDALAARGLEPLEVLVTSSLGPTSFTAPPPPDAKIEHVTGIAAESDAIAIGELTARAITISHFHADPRLPRDLTARLYATWARNDVMGRAQRTIIARAGEQIAGYIAVLESRDLAVIDLIAVDDVWRGRGIGSALLASFVSWVQQQKLRAKVGTQSDNRALDLYRRAGFAPTARQLTYHLWLD